MALRGLARIAAESADVREVKKKAPLTHTQRVRKHPSPAAPPALTTDQSLLRDQVIALIPAETLAPTVALFGYFANYDWRVRGLIVVVAAVLTPIWVWINFVDQAQTDEARKAIPWGPMLLGAISYLVWVGSIPATPYLRWHAWDLQLGAGLVLISGLLLGGVVAFVRMLRRRRTPVVP